MHSRMTLIEIVKATPVDIRKIAAEAYDIREQKMVLLHCMFGILIWELMLRVESLKQLGSWRSLGI